MRQYYVSYITPETEVYGNENRDCFVKMTDEEEHNFLRLAEGMGIDYIIRKVNDKDIDGNKSY